MSDSVDACAPGEAHCITCGDEGIPMYVVEVRDGLAIAVDEHRNRHTVATDLVEPVALGDELLVHAGVAIAQLATAQLATAQLATAQLATAGAAPEGPRQ